VAVKIRLSRLGRKKIPFYRIIVCDEDSKRDGRNLEIVGTYNTLTNPATITLKEDRVKYWLSVGARPTLTTSRIIIKSIPGYFEGLEKKRLEKIRATRSKRKARAKSAGKTAAPKAAKAKGGKKATTKEAAA
jgi:small subunit ribosomal protein S16